MIGRRLALLIANNEFIDTNFQQLKAPEHDASSLESLLKNPDLCNFYVKTLINKTSYEVNQAIEEFYADSTRTDLLLLYFSGHGIKDEEGKLYFVTKDTRRNRLRTTAIPSRLINEGMRESRSRRQLLILDCCYSGAFAKGMIAKAGNIIGSSIGSIERFQGRGRVILTASDAMQYAFEEESLIQGTGVHSIFSSAIIDGLSTFNADENKDGIITIDELYDYVDEYVTDRTPNQRPSIWAYEVQGEIVIATKPLILTETIIPTPQPEKMMEPEISDAGDTFLETVPVEEPAEETPKDIIWELLKPLGYSPVPIEPAEETPKDIIWKLLKPLGYSPASMEPAEESVSKVMSEHETKEIDARKSKKDTKKKL
jgi:hypothetical protein